MRWDLTAAVALSLLLFACGGDSPSADTPQTTDSNDVEVGSVPDSSPTIVSTDSPTQTPIPTATPSPTAVPRQSTVYLEETYKGKSFESAAEWRRKLVEWESRRPEHPGLLESARGAGTGRQVSGQLNRTLEIRNDKWKHCVAGSEIALATNVKTAEYAAWYKEYLDLTDGDPDTRFEEEDYEATVDGAYQVDTDPTCEDCADRCEERWGGRYQLWDGEKPSDEFN